MSLPPPPPWPPPPPGPRPPEQQIVAESPASIRTDAFVYDVLDRSHQRIGRIFPVADDPPGYSLAVEGDAGRVLRDFRVLADLAVDLNPSEDRIRPSYVDQATGDLEPLGVYRIAGGDLDASRPARLVVLDLADESSRLAENLDRNLTFSAGTSVVDAAERVATLLGLPAFDVGATTAELGRPLSFRRGEASWLDVANRLASVAGMLRPYFDRFGVWRWRISPVWETANPNRVYRPGDRRVLADSTSRGVQFLGLPNAWYAISGTGDDAVVASVYRLPDSAPNSEARIGREVPVNVTVDVDEGESAADAARAAAADALGDSSPGGLRVVFDPTVELWDLVEYDGLRWQVRSASAELGVGRPLTLTLRRIHTRTDPAGETLGGLL